MNPAESYNQCPKRRSLLGDAGHVVSAIWSAER